MTYCIFCDKKSKEIISISICPYCTIATMLYCTVVAIVVW